MGRRHPHGRVRAVPDYDHEAHAMKPNHSFARHYSRCARGEQRGDGRWAGWGEGDGGRWGEGALI